MSKIRGKLIKEIFDITALLQKNYPDVYANLTEVPTEISYNTKAIKDADYHTYLDFLKSQLERVKKVRIV